MKAARDKPYSSKYRLNLYSVLKKMFNVAMAYDLITTSPVRAEIHQPVHERAENSSFTPEQLRALTQHVPPENGSSSRRQPRLKTKKSRSGDALPPALFDRLNRHKEASAWTGDQDSIFCRADGRPLDPDSFRRQVFHPAMDAARIERVSRGDGLQALRHSSGTILYLITRDLEKVKDVSAAYSNRRNE
jgi:hypothetical protein